MARIQASLRVATADLEAKQQDMRTKVARAVDLKRQKARLSEKAKTEKREVMLAKLAERKAHHEYEAATQRAGTTRQEADRAQVVVALARQEAEHAAGLAAAEKARGTSTD